MAQKNYTTTFPRLDTEYSNHFNQRADRYEQFNPTYRTVTRTISWGDGDSPDDDDILRAYASFIGSLTTEDEIAFEYELHEVKTLKSTKGVLVADLAENAGRDDASPASRWSLTEAKRATDAQGTISTDFGIVVADSILEERSGQLRKLFLVEVIRSQNYLVRVIYEAGLMSEDFAQSLAATFVRHIARSADEPLDSVDGSMLNFPCLQRPPQLPQDSKYSLAFQNPAILHKAFERRSREYPERLALDFLRSPSTDSVPAVHETLTYLQLNRLSTALALELRPKIPFRTDGKQVVIPAYISTSPALYVAWLGVLKAGLVFCPIPIDAAPEQIATILEDVAATIVLGTGPRPRRPPWDESQRTERGQVTDRYNWIDVETFIHDTKVSSCPSLSGLVEKEIGEDSLAYIMYTSGSTGKPKGVQISHLAASCSIASHAIYIPEARTLEGFRWFQFAAPTFDPSVMEIFTTLSTGGTLVSAPRELSLTDPEKVITDLAATIMMATPSLARLLRPGNVPTLQSLWTMGELLNRQVIENFAPRLQNQKEDASALPGLLNAYGPTEASINCTLAPNFPPSQRGAVIGVPTATASLFVLQPSKLPPAPVPLGMPGELAIAGPQLSLGYLNRPEQTQAAFVVSPEFGRMYLTGDRVRVVRGPSGALMLEFLGRLTDDQVKLSGRRVELGAIEAAFAPIPSVKEAVACIHKVRLDMQGSEQIAACIVSDGTCQQDALIAQCEKAVMESLPAYMRPAKYFIISRVPRSTSGKVDRKTATKMAQELWTASYSSDSESESRLSESETDVSLNDRTELRPQETLMLGVLSHLLQTSSAKISTETDLLSLGVDSLLAVAFLQELRAQGIQNINVPEVLGCRNVRKICDLVESKQQDLTKGLEPRTQNQDWADHYQARHLGSCARSLAVQETDIEQVLPTTATQSGIVSSFMRSLATGSGSKRYINHSVYHIKSRHDLAEVHRSFVAVLRRGQMWRTAFVQVDDELSPFCQCTLSPNASLSDLNQRTFKSYGDRESMKSLLDDAISWAEESIALERPPLALATVKTPEGSAILLSLFHGIFDGGSLELLLKDVEDDFNLREPTIRPDIKLAVERHFGSDRHRSSQYWSEYLTGYSRVEFPHINPSRPELASSKAHVLEILSSVTLDALQRKAQSLQASSLALLQIAWSSLLFDYTGSQADICFGSVISDRFENSTAACLAPTFVTVPVRVSFSTGDAEGITPSVARVASQLTDSNAKALSVLHVPLSSITVNGQLPYDTLFAFQRFPEAGQSDLWSSIEYPPMDSDFGVMIEIWPMSSGNIRFKATYKHTHLDDLAAHTMLRQFDNIVSSMIHHSDLPVTGISTNVEDEMLSQIHAKTFYGKHDNSLLHSAFEKHAKQTPEAMVLIYQSNLQHGTPTINWTYRDLNEKACRLSQKLLQQFGSLRGAIVLICMKKVPELYVSILALLKLGAAWCPVDVKSPSTRQHEIMRMAEGKILLVAGETSSLPAAAVPPEVVVFDVSLTQRGLYDENSGVEQSLIVDVQPHDRAYLIFTSGTTGKPKGVPITHEAAVTCIGSLVETIPSDVNGKPVRCLQFSQYTFDIFVQDLFYTWAVGGALISSPQEIMLQSFAQLANTLGATHAHLTPAFSATVPRERLETLKVVTMIGEKLTQSVADDWSQGLELYNTYGPAETTIVSTYRRIAGPSDPYKSYNIGLPLRSIGTYVLRDGQLLLKNGIGELAIAGDQLSPGYWNNPSISASKFVWNDRLGQILYLTGDIVRMYYDGSIEFIGRNDDLVKLGGIRVELSEISFSLRNFDPAVDGVEVLQCEMIDGAKKLVVAFVACSQLPNHGDQQQVAIVSKEAAEIARHGMEHALSVLPEYMIPAAFIVVNAIPRTASAKVDRKALATIFREVDLTTWEAMIQGNEAEALQDYRSWTNQHVSVLKAVSQISGLPVSAFRPKSTLAGIGVDSIGAIRLTQKLRGLHLDLSVLDVLNCRNLIELTSLATSSHEDDRKGFQVLEQFNRQWHAIVAEHLSCNGVMVLPTTVLQESLLSETVQNHQMYWSNHFFKLREEVDLRTLREAWSRLASNTDALRVGFIPKAIFSQLSSVATEDESPFIQIVYPEVEIDWCVRSIQGEYLQVAAEKRAREIAEKQQKSMFSGPLWAVSVFQDISGVTMMFTVHHTIYDGPSLDLLAQNLLFAYDDLCPVSSGLSWAEALLRTCLTSDKEASHAFWQNALEDFSPEGTLGSALQPKDTAGENPHHRTLSRRMSLTYETARTSAAQIGAISVASIIRVAWGAVLAELMETSDVLFAEVMSDRIVDSTLERTIGPLISVVPVPFKMALTAREAIDRQDTISKGAKEHRWIRPGKLRSMLSLPAGQMLYPAMFTFHYQNDDEQQPSHLWEKEDDILELSVEHAAALNIWQDSNEHLLLELSIEDRLLSHDMQLLLLQHLDALTTAINENPDSNMTSLTKLFPRDLISCSRPREDTQAPSDKHPTYWIDHWAATHPDWVATEIARRITLQEVQTETWTYAELNCQANKVANYIDSKGLKRSTIALCMGRTLLAYAIILGIMKSGNTYVPIDETFPNERKEFMTSDAEVAVCFTDSVHFEGVRTDVSCEIIDIEDHFFLETLQAMSNSYTPSKDGLDDDCYILYTSGSTGKPKGVLVTFRNLSSFMEAQSEFICDEVPQTLELGGEGKYLGLASRAFDVHIGEMFLAWRHGLAAVSAPKSMLLDDLGLALTRLRITHSSFVPSLLDQTGLTPDDAPMLVFLGVGGEKMSAKTKKLWAGHDRVRLINAYGPTEATIGCCSGRLLPQTDMKNIGRPLGDSIAHILVPGTDDYVKRGMPGELCFSGSLVAKGYLKRPDAKGFVENFDGKRLYRTGDIVRLMPDDSIEYLGRKDGQVKIRGQRVELGEVSEGVRVCSPQPLSVASMILKHPDLSRSQLVAFISNSSLAQMKSSKNPEILSNIQEVIDIDLRSECQKVLPVYMVPDVVVPLSYLPLAATSGKTDEKLLAKIFSSTPLAKLLPSIERNSVEQRPPPRAMTRAEKNIYNLIKEVIPKGPESVDPDVTVFELGVDSLSAISIFSKMRMLGYSCHVAMILQNPSIKGLARLPKGHIDQDPRRLANAKKELEALHGKVLSSGSLDIPAQSIFIARPCLPSQEVIVARSLQDQEGGFYVNHILLELEKGVDIDSLKEAWRQLFISREILRTCFSPFETGIVQLVLKCSPENLPWKQLDRNQQLSPGSLEQLQAGIAADICSHLTQLPPFRLTLWNNSDSGKWMFQISIHHSLYDGLSLSMLFDDLLSIYTGRGLTERQSIQSMVDFIAAQDLEQAKEYWTDMLNNWETTSLFGDDQPRQDAMTTMERTLAMSASTLQEGASKMGLTLAAFLQGIFSLALAQLQGFDDLVIGVVLSGRSVSLAGADSIMAPCIATIPQRVTFKDHGMTASAHLTNFQRTLNSSLEYQHISPRDIQRWVRASRPLYDCLCSFSPRVQPTSLDAPWKQISNDITVDYNLAVEFESDLDQDYLIARAGIQQAYDGRRKLDLLLENIETIATAIIKGNDIPISSLGLSPANLHQASLETQVWNEDDWSEDEVALKKTIGAFCDVPTSQIQKSTLFIQLGIDSVTVIRLAKKLREQGTQVSSSDLLRHNCIGALSAHLAARSETGPLPRQARALDAEAVRIKLREKTSSHEKIEDWRFFPCTPLQTGMILQTLASSDGKLYVHHHAFQLQPEIDLEKLRAAWTNVIATDDILRTSFHDIGDTKFRMIGVVHASYTEVTWNERYVDDLSQGLRNVASECVFTKERDFEKPPHQVSILQTESKTLLVISIHHSLYDGMSLQMMMRQFHAAYLQLSQTSVSSFVEAANAIAERQVSSVNFWTESIKDYKSIELPTDESGEMGTFYLEETPLTLEPASLDESCRNKGIALQEACLFAFGKALCCLVGRRDICFGHVVHGRNITVNDDRDIIGPMFNAVPFRIRLDDTVSTNQSEVQRIRKVISSSLDYQHASLAAIQKEWRVANHDSVAPLIDSLFTFQKIDEQTNPDADILWKPWVSDDVSRPSEYRLNFEVEQNDNCITARAYSDIGKASTRELLNRFVQGVHDILDNPRRFAAAIPTGLRDLPLEVASNPITDGTQAHVSKDTRHYGIIRDALAEVAGVPASTITATTTTYSLGLDSIAAIQIASKCRRGGIQLGLTDIIRGVTLAKICELAIKRDGDNQMEQVVDTETTSITPEVRSAALSRLHISEDLVADVLPCLAGQDYHLSAWLQSGRTLYEPAWTYKAREKLNPDKLKDAWQVLQQRHEILRTTFVSLEAGEAIQVILKEPASADRTMIIQQCQENTKESAKAQARKDAFSPSDFFSPPIRLRLVQARDGDVVQILLNHSLYDAWTMPRMVTELSSLYSSMELGPTRQFSSFARHMTRRLSSLNEKEFWGNNYKSFDSTLIPSAKPYSTSVPSSQEQTFIFTKSRRVTAQALEQLCRSKELSINQILLLAFGRVLAKNTGAGSPLFGLFQFGRTDNFEDIEDVSGPCVNVLPFGIHNINDSGTEPLLRQIHENLQSIQPFEQSRLRHIAKWISNNNSNSNSNSNPATPTQLPFNAYINVLWNKSLLRGGGSENSSTSTSSPPLLTPLPIGVPTDFSSPHPLPGPTAIDTLDHSFLPPHNLYVDVGPDWEDDCIVFGVRCDRDMMDEPRVVREVVDEFEKEILRCVGDV